MPGKAEHKSSIKQAPEPLNLVRRFLNTRNRMRDYDLLGDSGRAEQWLSEADYRSGVAVGESELKRLRALREDLRTILAAHTLGPSEESRRCTARLDEFCASVSLRPGFDREGEPQLSSTSENWERFVENLLVAAVWARHTGIWKRLKACANEECRWVFYDHSKNRSGNWCVMEICGSRAKMRAYRRRRGSRSTQSPR